MVPVEVEMQVDADSPADAELTALSKFHENPSSYIVGNSEDYGAANQWVPFIEELP